jgi:DNA topoisomerase I
MAQAMKRKRTTAPRRAKRAPPTPAPEHSAQAAGLRHVSDSGPGIRRRRAGRGFSYVGPDGRPVRDRETLERIRRLAIPPAYRDVWICPDPRGHLQATGRDARGRKQYRYHPAWREARDETKFGRMLAFAEALPGIRARVDADLRRQGLPREKVLAAVVSLLERTCIRVGNDEYARSNRSFGLTTLRDRHVEISGSSLRFEFRGKSGKLHSVDLDDRRLARIVQHCQSIPGEELFQYLDEHGDRQTLDSGDVNAYLREISGEDFTAKDFRTWAGTMLAAAALTELGPGDSAKLRRANILSAIDQVAGQLNNTRAVCRKYYVHPAILDSYEDGRLLAALRGVEISANGSGPGLSPTERTVMRLIQRRLEAA